MVDIKALLIKLEIPKIELNPKEINIFKIVAMDNIGTKVINKTRPEQ